MLHNDFSFAKYVAAFTTRWLSTKVVKFLKLCYAVTITYTNSTFAGQGNVFVRVVASGVARNLKREGGIISTIFFKHIFLAEQN